VVAYKRQNFYAIGIVRQYRIPARLSGVKTA
jgi:hypothetical protein